MKEIVYLPGGPFGPIRPGGPGGPGNPELPFSPKKKKGNVVSSALLRVPEFSISCICNPDSV